MSTEYDVVINHEPTETAPVPMDMDAPEPMVSVVPVEEEEESENELVLTHRWQKIPEQEDASHKISSKLSVHNELLLFANAGSGKTNVAVQAIRHGIRDGTLSHVLILAPNVEVATQWAQTFNYYKVVVSHFFGDKTVKDSTISTTRDSPKFVVVTTHAIFFQASNLEYMQRWCFADAPHKKDDGLVVVDERQTIKNVAKLIDITRNMKILNVSAENICKKLPDMDSDSDAIIQFQIKRKKAPETKNIHFDVTKEELEDVLRLKEKYDPMIEQANRIEKDTRTSSSIFRRAKLAMQTLYCYFYTRPSAIQAMVKYIKEGLPETTSDRIIVILPELVTMAKEDKERFAAIRAEIITLFSEELTEDCIFTHSVDGISKWKRSMKCGKKILLLFAKNGEMDQICGLNLQDSNMILTFPLFGQNDEEQVIGRIDRIGQRNTTLHQATLVCNNGGGDYMWDPKTWVPEFDGLVAKPMDIMKGRKLCPKPDTIENWREKEAIEFMENFASFKEAEFPDDDEVPMIEAPVSSGVQGDTTEEALMCDEHGNVVEYIAPPTSRSRRKQARKDDAQEEDEGQSERRRSKRSRGSN
jgi:hypothetical protein